MANDPAKQAINASKPLQKRIKDAAVTAVSPEMEDAIALQERLEPEVANRLMTSGKDLPQTPQYDEARSNALLSMQARHDLIVRLFAQGMRKERIARAMGVNLGTVEKVLTGYFNHKEQELRMQRMDSFVLHMAEGYIEDMDRLQDIIARSSHAGAIVGAIKARNDAREKYTNLLADFGFIARKPTEVHVSGDNATIDARTQNVIVVSQDELKSFTRKVLADKRAAEGLDSDDITEGEVIDADGGNSLVVTGDH